MSLQWALIAGFLYLEIAVVLLLVLPLISARRWQSFFKSRFLQTLSSQAQLYFLILLAILILFFLDAIREMRKYSDKEHTADHQHLDAEMQSTMRLFRAQRNFYISGFALFLSLVIRRLVTLISTQATLEACSEASMKQAQSATQAARQMMTSPKEELQELNNEINELKKELAKEKLDKEAVLRQSENLSEEYDRVSKLNSELERKLAASEPSKKDD
ncbi:B-cell receptor-associated protein 31 [Cloeon dipterum]|uniref:B-cell receptor-associated protein 31 n=1 Tax=Cloeon dipterum TaxID=197152 RepID=UPI00321FD19E